MALKPLRVGAPLDVLTMNAFWNKVYIDTADNRDDVTFSMKFARMWHHDARVSNGGSLAAAALGADAVGRRPYHRYWHQSPPLQFDTFVNAFTLSAGTYDFIALCRTTPDSGIINWITSSDDSIGTMNLYDATGADLVVKTITGVTISTSGLNLLSGQIFDTDPSSSGYAAYLYKYCFREQ